VKKPKIDDYNAILIAYNTNSELYGYTFTLKIFQFGISYNYSIPFNYTANDPIIGDKPSIRQNSEYYSFGISIIKDLKSMPWDNFGRFYITVGAFFTWELSIFEQINMHPGRPYMKSESILTHFFPEFVLGLGYHFKPLMFGLGYYFEKGTYFQAGIAF
jgi:hypothetical protein